MSFNKQTIQDIELKGRRVLLRADFNVPIEDGVITDDYRIKQALPTIRYILEQECSLVIISHLGRPTGSDDASASLMPVSTRLAELLGKDVQFASDSIGDAARTMCAALPPHGIVLLENLRYHPEEEKNDETFAKAIIEASGAEVFVQDGFGVVHRAHASTDAIARQNIPAVAGLLLEREVDIITKVMEEPKRPLVAIIGGAKVSDKIEILERLLEHADCVAVVGAMANTFLAVQGYAMGSSVLDEDSEDIAEDILERAEAIEKKRPFRFIVPTDIVVSTDIEGTKSTRVIDLASHTLHDIEFYPKVPPFASYTLTKDEMALDIGPVSAARIAGAVDMASTVLWNGTCGVTETEGINGAPAPFSHATRMIVDAIVGVSNHHANRAFSLVGGGDTVGYVQSQGLTDDFDHVSTGGGASLELMSGKELPGVSVLNDKEK